MIGNNQLLHDDTCQVFALIQPRHHNKQLITLFEPVHTLLSVGVSGSVLVSGSASTAESRSTRFLLLDFDGWPGSKGVIEAVASS